MTVLQWAGWAGLFAAAAGLLRDRWARQSEHEKTIVSARQVEVTASQVEVQEKTADAGMFSAAIQNYHDLVDTLREEIDIREARHQRDIAALNDRITALEAENVRCKEQVAKLQQEVGEIAAENYKLRQRGGL